MAAVEKTFQDLGICEELAVSCSLVGRNAPTKWDRKIIPAVLEGKDILGIGNYEIPSFVVPILNGLHHLGFAKPTLYACVLTSSTELAAEIYQHFNAFGLSLFTGFQCIMLDEHTGNLDDDYRRSIQKFIIVTTPSMLATRFLDGPDQVLKLDTLKYFVMYNADKFVLDDFTALHCLLEVLPNAICACIFCATLTFEVMCLKDCFLASKVKRWPKLKMRTGGSFFWRHFGTEKTCKKGPFSRTRKIVKKAKNQ